MTKYLLISPLQTGKHDQAIIHFLAILSRGARTVWPLARWRGKEKGRKPCHDEGFADSLPSSLVALAAGAASGRDWLRDVEREVDERNFAFIGHFRGTFSGFYKGLQTGQQTPILERTN
jgi:hypothetical protein